MPGGGENQELGDLGESDFQGWCIRNSLRCTKSNPDRMGWDFFVEFPSQATRGRSLDSQNDLKKVMIQVKSSRNKFEHVRCKLSALKNLVDADIPAFIACLQFNGDNRVIHAMLVHIGTAAIEVILRRVRQAEADGAPDLHRTFLSLPLDDANEIHLDGSNLRALLEQHIGSSNSQYLQQKIRARASCGYDHNSIGVNFSFDGDDEQLVEFLIGRHPEITITNLTIQRRRFGIALPSDIDRIENGTLSVKSSDAAEATITVSNKTLGRTVTLAAEISSTAGIELPQNLHRMRLNNDCFDIVFNF
ncbi:hypothetical protein LRC39_01790 [Rhodopseudomonas sp. P1]|uniref:hypothetical protein n=1 Tax=Rhodopseudomonas sp. P1 TaxID=3434357 RepID=UPI0031FC2334